MFPFLLAIRIFYSELVPAVIRWNDHRCVLIVLPIVGRVRNETGTRGTCNPVNGYGSTYSQSNCGLYLFPLDNCHVGMDTMTFYATEGNNRTN